MRTKQLKVRFSSGDAYLHVEDGCGEIRVVGFAPSDAVEELRTRLGIGHQFMGAYRCDDRKTCAIDYRVPLPPSLAYWAEPVTVRTVTKALGIRWHCGKQE